jgi:hypothetical protein
MAFARGVGSSRVRGASWVALALALIVGCSAAERPPFRPVPKPDAGQDEQQDGEAGSAGMPPPPHRPSGAVLQEMVAALAALGADVDDPDRVCAGWAHACGIDFDGVVHCFGDNSDGRSEPPPIEAEVTQVACGTNFSCALDDQGTIACWGAGTDPDLLDTLNQAQSIPPEGAFQRIAIAASGFHACAIDEHDEVQCWGGGSIDKPLAAQGNWRQAVPQPGTFVDLAAGEAHTCGIRDTGEIRCWGGGGDRCAPPFGYACGQTSAPEGNTFVDVTAGEFHSCALRDDGTATCWGTGLATAPCNPGAGTAEFECGQGLVPEEVQTRIARIRAGNLHTCAITTDYEAVCWGWNSEGQTEVPILYAFSQIAGGDQFSCGWTTGQTLECWGAVPAVVPEPLAFPPK